MTDRFRSIRAGRPGSLALEVVAWIAILALAAILRLPDLAARGSWDADQGHDMLVLRHLVVDGTIPLLGPPTSIGDFHHGVLYYALLAPPAFLSGADPVAVTTWIAVGGILAVATTGWLARSIAGPWAGVVAGLLMAVSASAVGESIVIWNPNVIALSSSIALAAAWRGHVTGRTAWWAVAGAAAVVTMQCHVLGVILTPVIAGLLVADGRSGRRVGRAAIAWIAIAAVSYLPLAIHELGNDASELRGAIAFLAGGGGSSDISLPIRLVVTFVRVLSWPLTGLLSDAPVAALLAAGLVVAIVAWRGWLDAGAEGIERTAVRWLGLGLAWTVVALAIAAPSLATIVPGLPNDHYHAFADPMVVALVGIGAAAAFRQRAVVARAATTVAVAGIAAFNLVTQPPAVAPDGGWRAARSAAERTAEAVDTAPFALVSLPEFKSDEALRMPLEAIGRRPVAGQPTASATVVVMCDQRFHEAIGAACG
ncbi:MAG TPA: hypothetical protein VFJ71_06425, partial [Candidatus Limnocylindrales bacterium]|nr:hypothetical protein [Candidatus Limnocylindrales bacterium]